jgi:hypothetical protein
MEGVERSFANRSGTLIRLTLKPGADAEHVTTEATKQLAGREGNQNAARLSDERATAAVQSEEWRDATRIRELSTIEYRTLWQRAIIATILIGVTIGGTACWWRASRRRLTANRSQ